MILATTIGIYCDSCQCVYRSEKVGLRSLVLDRTSMPMSEIGKSYFGGDFSCSVSSCFSFCSIFTFLWPWSVSGKGEQSAACPIACGERIRRRVGPELENYHAPKFGACRIGAGPNVAGEHRPQLGEEL